jgi:hypothetical protein
MAHIVQFNTKDTGSSPAGGDVGGGGGESAPSQGGAKPKISDMKIPNEGDADKQAEVEQHNKEFEQRYDRAPKAQDDKVDKKFWSGESGNSSWVGHPCLEDVELTIPIGQGGAEGQP